jgi:hypothetical protein
LKCASELVESHGETGEALHDARRAVDAEMLSERAHPSAHPNELIGALVRALIASGDRAGARRARERCLSVLEADGLNPEDETLRLGAEV